MAVGLVMLADCQLTGQFADGRAVKINEHTRKIFSLGKFAVATYCGNRWSAINAISRVSYYVFRQKTRVTMNHQTIGRIRKYAYKGAKAAERYQQPSQGKVAGPFCLLVGFIDDIAGVALLEYSYNMPGRPQLLGISGAPRMVVIGSGAVVASDVYAGAMEHLQKSGLDKAAFESLHPGHQGGFLAAALDAIMRQKPVPYSSGGVQIMSLDPQQGHMSWGLYSSTIETAELYGLQLTPGPLPPELMIKGLPGVESSRAEQLFL